MLRVATAPRRLAEDRRVAGPALPLDRTASPTGTSRPITSSRRPRSTPSRRPPASSTRCACRPSSTSWPRTGSPSSTSRSPSTPSSAESWELDEHTIYGRFDLSYDGQGPPKLLEYNADTPTALLEAAVIQWFWSKDLIAGLPAVDRPAVRPVQQHPRAADRGLGADPARAGATGSRSRSMDDSLEDVMTVTYLRDTATQAGLKTESLAMGDLGWHAGRRRLHRPRASGRST